MLNNLSDIDFAQINGKKIKNHYSDIEKQQKKNPKHNTSKSNNDTKNRNINNNQSPNVFSQLSNSLVLWYNSLTFTIKVVVTLSVILWIFDLITLNTITNWLANVPYYSLNHCQFWRFITGNFITTGLFNFIFALIFWVSGGKIVEKQQGTVKYFIYFLINSTLVQIVYAVIYDIFTNDLKEPTKIVSNGIWAYIMCEVTLMCLIKPDNEIYLLCIPYPIKSKYFPIVILIIFIIIGGFEFDIFVGVGYGFLYGFIIKKYLVINDGLFKKWEIFYFQKFVGFKGFIKMSEISMAKEQPFIDQFGGKTEDNQKDSDGESSDSDGDSEKNGKNFFSDIGGKTGIALGNILGGKMGNKN